MIGIASLIIMEGFTESITGQSENNLKKVETAHIKIFAKGYWKEHEKEPLKFLIKDYSYISNKLSEIKEIKGITGRISFQAKVYSGKSEMPCIGYGIEFKGGDQKVFKLSDSIAKGTWLKDGENALMGIDFAKLFDVEPSSNLTIEFKDKNGIYDAIQAEVSGIFETGHPDIDSGALYLPLDVIQERLDMKGMVTEIAIVLKSEKKMNAFREKLVHILKEDKKIKEKLEVLTWREQAAAFLAFQEQDLKGNYVTIFILLIIVVAGIMNTMLMSVLERVREIGALMAMGMKSSMVRIMFLLEGAIIGLIGSILGMFIGFIFMIFYSKNGINLASMYGEQDMIYYVKDYIYGNVRFAPFLYALLIGVFFAILASYLPARNASKLKPVVALRRY
jgi:ABC-type lipoprotein release transport system permease subunit